MSTNPPLPNPTGPIEYIPVVMIRPNLRHVPRYALPAGFRFRMYRPGDREAWLGIWQAAEKATGLSTISGGTFDSNFGSDLPAMERRCFFIVSPDGQDIGTTTAWYDYRYADKHWGRVHWVAILPQFQGRGLAKPLMTVILEHMRRLGHRRAILGTQTPRLAAIKTYLNFGFEPDMTTRDADKAWRLVARHLPHPALGGIGL